MSRQVFSHTTQDEYYTPKYAVKIIADRILPSTEVIWCPFDKEDSNYVVVLRNMGFKVVATHIDNGENFLTYKPVFPFDMIVSNPPFSLKTEIRQKCLEYDKPFALLLPFTMLNSIKTINQIAKCDIQFLIMDRRISFNGERPNFTCWYVCYDVLDRSIEYYLFDKDPKELYKLEIA